MIATRSFVSEDIIYTNNISDSLRQSLFKIEQDMWARGIGEYLKCLSCSKIYSKNDIYGDGGLLPVPIHIRNKVIYDIERIIKELPQCGCGCGDLVHIYSYDEYMEEILDRHNKENYYLALSRNEKGKVVGFMDGYIDSLEEIFNNEFSQHFTPNILDYIWERYKKHKSQPMLTVCSLGMNDENKSLLKIFKLLEEFFSFFDTSFDNLDVIVESIISSTTYTIFDLMGASKLSIQNHKDLLRECKANDNYPTDILIQPGAIKIYRDNFNIRTRDVLLHCKSYEDNQ